MLYNIVCSSGNDELKQMSWSLNSVEINDLSKIKFIENPVIRQKIRISDNDIDYSLISSRKDEENFNIEIIEIDPSVKSNIIFINNNKNMNLSLLTLRKKGKNPNIKIVTPALIWVTIDNKEYKLASYHVAKGANIVQTYRSKDNYQGCAIKIPDIEGFEEKFVIRLYVKNLITNKPGLIEVKLNDEDKKVEVSETYRFDTSKEYAMVRTKCDNAEKKWVHFRVSFPEGYFPTNVYIMDTSDPDIKKKANDLISKFKPTVIECPTGDSIFNSDDEEVIKAYDDAFKLAIVDNKIRAVTTINMKLPKDFCKKYRVLYLFSLDPETGKVTCIKSN